ncbi:MAG TPA: carboxypeptidase M32 [Oscillospiraceae bacterium]|nr:carboxypeptidase M32 [Oscillospiraceae bacterium]HNW04250.1 carboxypeptidase M32 [Oscillospiraceae bacterium]
MEESPELKENLEKLALLQKQLFAYKYACSAVELDSLTVAPPDTVEGRSEALGVLSGFQYLLSTCPETVGLLNWLRAHKEDLTAHQAREVELLLRDQAYIQSIPQQEYVDYQKMLSKAESAWRKAKSANDFAAFRPYLERIFDDNIRFAKYYKPDQAPYDTQLDLYERGLTMEKADRFFAVLREGIVPLIQKIAKASRIDDTPLLGVYPVEKQKQLTNYLMDFMGIDLSHCNCSETEHPFTLEFTNEDVRITTHYYENNFAASMYSVIHEGGHALYELGGSDEHRYTAVAGGVSMGIHESQSRFFENIIGRSEPFINAVFPKIQELFPENFATVTPRQFYEMINRSEPSLIRIEADELTYPLHVMVRYEIEKKLFAGELSYGSIPAEWNRLYKEYLGVDVPDDTRGCLQDSHWSGGSVGYFPSYALGSAYGAQMFETMKEDVDVDAAIASGSLKPLVDWLNVKIYGFGSLYDPERLFRMVCGAPFDPHYYVDYLTKKFSELYHL